MAELFKFRCYQCQKMIGAPPSRFGKVVKCPRCGVDLVVPSPQDDPAPEGEPEAGADAVNLGDLGLSLGTEPLSGVAIAPRSQPPTFGPDPIAFLRQAADTEDFPTRQDDPESPTDPVGPGPGPDETPDLPEPGPEPLVPRRKGARASVAGGVSGRARDVVLPRTALVAWALFALLGLAFAFTSGLFLGQRLGR